MSSDARVTTGGGGEYSNSGGSGSGGGGSGSPGGPPVTGGGGSGGVDTGGAQDISYVRQLIASGEVPPASALTVEGLFSEHDVPTSGAPCNSLLCLRPAVGAALSLETGQIERWVHVGMTTGLTDLQRPPTDLVVAIDKSGSMSIDMTETTGAVTRLIDHMRDTDRLAVLAFDDTTHVLQELGPVTDKDALKAKVKALTTDGYLQIDKAFTESFSRLQASDARRLRRVVILSCSYPTISLDGEDATSKMIRAQGEKGIGLTMVGVLLGWDANLAGLLGKSNGANYYYLSGLDQVMQVFDTNFDHIVTPLAYDIDLKLSVAAGYKLDRMYGIPGDASGAPADGYTIATAFPSNKRGSIVARLGREGAGEPPVQIATTTFSYRPEASLGYSTAEDQSVASSLGALDASGSYYESNGVRKAVFLVNEATQIKRACDEYHNAKHDEAKATLTARRDQLKSENAILVDADLEKEIAMVEKLLTNMQ